VLVALGLGNPGQVYEGTRHNVGKEVVLSLIEELGLRAKPGKGCYSYASDPSRDLVLVIPTTYMNASGQAAKQALEHLGAATQDLLVVCDDFALPAGMIRIRKQGGYGGHNGLASIIYDLNSEVFPRLRIGVGPVPGAVSPVDFVLSRFETADEPPLQRSRAEAREALLVIAASGLDRAMNAYNRKAEDSHPDSIPDEDGN
jgi:PTH1 family peptidyl-tRNA hydrolase